MSKKGCGEGPEEEKGIEPCQSLVTNNGTLRYHGAATEVASDALSA